MSYLIFIDDESLANDMREDVEDLRSHTTLSRLTEILVCDSVETAFSLICERYEELGLAVFDSRFAQDQFAGSDLFCRIRSRYPDIGSRAVFFTAYANDVRTRLADETALQVILKGRQGYERVMELIAQWFR